MQHRWRLLLILGALMGFASISTDFYLPALPTMATSLHTNAGTVEFTISGYLIGFSSSQLFWGPLGDRHGRRAPIAITATSRPVSTASADGTPWPMGWVVAVAGIGGLLCTWMLRPARATRLGGSGRQV